MGGTHHGQGIGHRSPPDRRSADPPRHLRAARPPLRFAPRRDHLHRSVAAQSHDRHRGGRAGDRRHRDHQGHRDAKNRPSRSTSEPPLPQDEVLSRLMFNRTASSITPLQAIQLAAAVNRLRGGGPGVLDRLRTTLGVDTLDVDGGGDGTGTTVRAGRYLAARRLRRGRDRHRRPEQPGPGRGRDPAEPVAAGGHRRDANSGVGLKWQFDY